MRRESPKNVDKLPPPLYPKNSVEEVEADLKKPQKYYIYQKREYQFTKDSRKVQ
jgi:hypothetical protein